MLKEKAGVIAGTTVSYTHLIPTTLKSSLTTKGEHDKSNKLQNLVAEQLVGCGFNEILNNSLTRAAYYDGLETYPSNRLVMLLNPLSACLLYTSD